MKERPPKYRQNGPTKKFSSAGFSRLRSPLNDLGGRGGGLGAAHDVEAVAL